MKQYIILWFIQIKYHKSYRYDNIIHYAFHHGHRFAQ